MGLFLNNVAGLQPETCLKKDFCTRVFLKALPNIFEHLSCKTSLGDCFSKISFCFSRQPQPQNVPIELTFSVLHYIHSERTFLFSESPRQPAITVEI